MTKNTQSISSSVYNKIKWSLTKAVKLHFCLRITLTCINVGNREQGVGDGASTSRKHTQVKRRDLVDAFQPPLMVKGGVSFADGGFKNLLKNPTRASFMLLATFHVLVQFMRSNSWQSQFMRLVAIHQPPSQRELARSRDGRSRSSEIAKRLHRVTTSSKLAWTSSQRDFIFVEVVSYYRQKRTINDCPFKISYFQLANGKFSSSR